MVSIKELGNLSMSSAAKKYRCGIIGYGYMGKIRQAVIERHPQLELAGILDPEEQAKPQSGDARFFSSFDELIRQVDIVFVCTPNSFSPDFCVRSLNAGKHVFCEKPPGRNLSDIRRIREAETGEVKLMFGFNHRFHPGILKAKSLVAGGRMGNIITLRGVYGKSGGKNFQKSWRNDKAISGGGILLDQGIHMLDLFCHFCGDFENVKCFANNTYWKFDLEDNAVVILQNKATQIACCTSSATLWKHTFFLHLTLEEGYLVVEGLLSKTGSYGREKLIVGKRQFEDEADALGNPSEEVTYFDRDLSWDLEVEEFVKCIEENRKVTLSSSADALKVMEIIERAYADAGLSAQEGNYNEEHCRIR